MNKMSQLININEQIKAIFPEKEFKINIYFGNVVKISLINELYVTAKEYHLLNQVLTISNISYDKDMDRFVIMGYSPKQGNH